MSMNSIDGSITSRCSNYSVHSVQALQSEISSLKLQLQGKESEFGELASRHQLALNQREAMETQMKKMEERVVESETKLMDMQV